MSCIARQKKNSNSWVVRKKILNETRNHNPPLQVKWAVPKCLDTFKIMLSMWICHLASLDKVTPKCLWFVVIGILFPLSEKLYPTVLENTIISVLSGLKDINQVFSSHKSWFITFSNSTTFWLEYPKEVSSAKSLLRERILSPISFM